MDCTQALESTQAYFDSSINDGESPSVVGWIEILGTKYELEQGSTKLGRDPANCKIILGEQNTISKEHAIFEVDGCHVTVCDLNSRNKSKLNQMYLRPQVRYALQGNEKLRFGDVSAKFIKAEKCEISDTDSETSLLPINLHADSSSSVLVPETPTYHFKPKSKLVFETPMQKSQHSIITDKKDENCIPSNKSNQGIGIIRSVTKMPRISDEYNSDESTDIEDYLETYKVSESPIADAKQSRQITITSDRDDPDSNSVIPSTDDMKDNSSEDMDLFQQPTQVVSLGHAEKNSSMQEAIIPDDIFNCATQLVSVPSASTPRQTRTFNETQNVLAAFVDSPIPKVIDKESHSIPKSIRLPPDMSKGTDVAEMEVSQSLIAEDIPTDENSILNDSEIRKINLFGNDCTEDLLSLVKLEPASQHDDSQELNIHSAKDDSSLVAMNKLDNDSDTIFNAATQVVDSTNTASLVRSKIANFSDLEPTQIVGQPVVIPSVREEITAETTQDILQVFNEPLQETDSEKVASDSESTQNVLNAFSEEQKRSFYEFNTKVNKRPPIKIRTDLTPTAANNFDLATQPVPIGASIDNKNISTDEDDSIYIMPTQESSTERSIFVNKSNLPGRSVTQQINSTAVSQSTDVFNMPTQCFETRNTTECESNASRSTLTEDKGHLDADNGVSSVILDTDESSIFDAPTQKFTQTARKIGLSIPENISAKMCDDEAQSLQEDADDVFMAATQVFNQNNVDVVTPLSDTDDIYNAATQIVPSTAKVQPPATSGECPKSVESGVRETVQQSSPDENDLSDSNPPTHSLSDEDTDIEDILEQANSTSDKPILAQKLDIGNKLINISDIPSMEEGNVRGSIPNEKDLGDSGANYLSNSSFKSSCVPSSEMGMLEQSKINSTLNDSSALHLVCSPGSDINTSVPSDSVKWKPASSPEKITTSSNRNASVSSADIPNSKEAQSPTSNTSVASAGCKVHERNDDFSGFDSSPTKTELNRSKTLILRKSINCRRKCSSSSDNWETNAESSSASDLSKNSVTFMKSSKNVAEVQTEESSAVRNNAVKHVSRAGKRGKKSAGKVIPVIKTVTPKPEAARRPNRRSKPPLRYSPVTAIEPLLKIEKNTSTKTRSVISAIKFEPETTTKINNQTLPLRDTSKRSQKMNISETNNNSRTRCSINTVVKIEHETPQKNTKQSPPPKDTRKRSSRIDTLKKVSSKRSAGKVSPTPEIPQAHSVRHSSRLSSQQLTSPVKSDASEQNLVLETGSRLLAKATDTNGDKLKTNKRKMRSVSESEEHDTSKGKLIKMETSERPTSRQRGRCSREKIVPSTSRLSVTKESLSDVSHNKDNDMDVTEDPQENDTNTVETIKIEQSDTTIPRKGGRNSRKIIVADTSKFPTAKESISNVSHSKNSEIGVKEPQENNTDTVVKIEQSEEAVPRRRGRNSRTNILANTSKLSRTKESSSNRSKKSEMDVAEDRKENNTDIAIKIEQSEETITRRRGRNSRRNVANVSKLSVISESSSNLLHDKDSDMDVTEEEQENNTVKVETVKIERIEPIILRRRGRSSRTMSVANTSNWSVTKESLINVSNHEKSNTDVSKEIRDSKSMLVSSVAKIKKQTKGATAGINENECNLKRKRSSRSVSSEIASPDVRRKSSRRTPMKSPPNEFCKPSIVCQTPKVMFTGYTDKEDEDTVKLLGGQLVESVKDCSVLVTTALKRTCKLLAAVGRGVTIAYPQWLEDSKKAGLFLDASSYTVSDKQTEEKFGFTLLNSMKKVHSNGPLFVGYSIHATKSVKPPPTDLKEIVECAGGIYLKTAPKTYSDKVIIISCSEDQRSWGRFNKLKFPVVGTELILSGLLRQKIEIEKNLL